jgi:hypothetical protein
MIEHYSFGRMMIDGQVHRRDLRLAGARVLPDWWRAEGHLCTLADLEAILEPSPAYLVVGTGASGNMRLAPGLEAALVARGVRLRAAPTAQAVTEYNAFLRDGVNVAGAFHLTC